jgi:hydrogenase maturation protein HypF
LTVSCLNSLIELKKLSKYFDSIRGAQPCALMKTRCAMVERRHLTVQGIVQGVGFRPFVYRLAGELNLGGWVVNSPQGVDIEVEAPAAQLDTFMTRLQNELPPHAAIHHLDWRNTPLTGENGFEIRHSDQKGVKTAFILPDLATCPDCLGEIHDPADRHYHYPFTNCTHCGPRFSIIRALPYDRANTTMRDFVMCDACRAEYENPLDRRFHAQPNACPHCGPQLALWGKTGKTLEVRHDALLAAAEALRHGQILALKGMGGFHLMVDVRNADAVARLRARKHREEKPLAVMYPSLGQIACEISELEKNLLTSSESPIVLLRCSGGDIAENIAPGNPYLGVMLPYTPLHHLLMDEIGFPIVATSGNFSGEPICTDEYEALERLGSIADLFLVHNRPIARHIDDSIVRIAAGRELMLRRARGYAPLPVGLSKSVPTLIAAGAHLKNTAAVTAGDQAFISQHIGDMDTPGAYTAYQHVINDFQGLYELHPSMIVCDLHPDYRSTQYAENSSLPIVRIQHHYAHVLSCMAENHLDAPVLGVSWDGTGYGADGTIWGGEFLLVNEHSFDRVAHLGTFRLPGGDQAVKEPRRSALGLLYSIFGDDIPQDLPPVQSFSASELTLLKTALRKGINAPLTSSAGRLFDAVAALIGLRQRVSFEGQAAMELEFAQNGIKTDKCYPFAVTDITGEAAAPKRIIDLKLTVLAMIDDLRNGVPMGEISAVFHNTLAEMIVTIARSSGEKQVVLTGGCFQNKTLLERAIDRLLAEGFHLYWHRTIPPNDGGVALGQIMAAIREQEKCV